MAQEILLMDKIKQSLYANYRTDQTPADISLFFGDTGMLVLQAILFEIDPAPALRTKLDYHFNHILTTIESATSLLPTYADGVAGVGTLIQVMADREIVDLDTEEFLEDLDLYLDSALEGMIGRKEFDPLHGAIGMANYYLRRNKQHQLVKILQVLRDTRPGAMRMN